MKKLLLAAGLLVALAPAAVVLTFLLFPLWNVLENVAGIEAVGHCGPPEWCYVATYAVLALIGQIAFWRRKSQSA